MLNQLEEAGMLNKMNVLVVSDHGMAEMRETFYLEEIVDENIVDKNRSVINVVSSLFGNTDADVGFK